MGEEHIPTESTPSLLYPDIGMFASAADRESRETSSSTAQLTEVFHSIMDEFLVESLETDISFALLDPNGTLIVQRQLHGTSDQLQPEYLSQKDFSEFPSVEIIMEFSRQTVTLVMRTSQTRADSMLMLRSLASALTARIEAEQVQKENGWLTTTLNRANIVSERQSTLFHLSKQLHELNDVNAILTEWIICLEMLYPQLQKQLYVSQDHLCPDIPVEPLSLYESDHLCTRAFMEGCIVIADDSSGTDTRSRAAAVPLKGKQGVYGVLHLLPKERSIPSSDLDFIGLLTETAGTAFENAQLFGQTVRLVQELQLINEITHRLNQSLKLQDIFQYAVDELTRIFHAEFACIIDLDHATNELVVRASDPENFMNERLSIDTGFVGLVIKNKEPVLLGDYKSNCEINSVWMEATEARSLLGCPILNHGEAVGAILMAHRTPNYFSYNNYKLLQVLSRHIGLALTNASLHAEVRRMVATDHLTGLYTRHFLDEQICAFQKKDACGSLVLLDIDNFKKVNDRHGHQIGDDVLIQVSRIIKSCIRDGDIPARWGGEELAIYFPKVNREQAIHVAERICRKVSEETSPQVTVSCGVSDWSFNEAKLSVETLFYRADMALYKAKNSGKNQIMHG
jgi:diguanylate cyclase (GGDEF)-like protein